MATIGGAILGVAASIMLLGTGRILGISGIVSGFIKPSSKSDATWRGIFLLGLLLGGAVVQMIRPESFAMDLSRSSLSVAISGLLVGFGALLGSGCTSGHGICGMSRLSPRSLVSVVTFMSFGIITVWIISKFFGGVI
jgi:uncharacterized membrane protein YedE/YeeE